MFYDQDCFPELVVFITLNLKRYNLSSLYFIIARKIWEIETAQLSNKNSQNDSVKYFKIKRTTGMENAAS